MWTVAASSSTRWRTSLCHLLSGKRRWLVQSRSIITRRLRAIRIRCCTPRPGSCPPWLTSDMGRKVWRMSNPTTCHSPTSPRKTNLAIHLQLCHLLRQRQSGALRVGGSDVSKLLESDDRADPTTENIVTLEARPQAQPPGAAEESERPCPGIWTSRRTIGVLRDYVA